MTKTVTKILHSSSEIFSPSNTTVSFQQYSPGDDFRKAVLRSCLYEKSLHPGETFHLSELSAEWCISLCKNNSFIWEWIHPTRWDLTPTQVISHLGMFKLGETSQLRSWTKVWRQTHKVKQKRFLHGMFYSSFFAIFYQKTLKFGFRVDGWVLTIKSKYFRDFPGISYFPKILSLKSFGNSWGNSYIHFLVIIIFFRFICGDGKLC